MKQACESVRICGEGFVKMQHFYIPWFTGDVFACLRDEAVASTQLQPRLRLPEQRCDSIRKDKNASACKRATATSIRRLRPLRTVIAAQSRPQRLIKPYQHGFRPVLWLWNWHPRWAAGTFSSPTLWLPSA